MDCIATFAGEISQPQGSAAALLPGPLGSSHLARPEQAFQKAGCVAGIEMLTQMECDCGLEALCSLLHSLPASPLGCTIIRWEQGVVRAP